MSEVVLESTVEREGSRDARGIFDFKQRVSMTWRRQCHCSKTRIIQVRQSVGNDR